LHDLLGISKAHPLIGFVGRLSPEKAPDVFVRMADLLRPAFPDAHFVIVGEGPLLGELRTLVNDLHLGSRVHFAGFTATCGPSITRSNCLSAPLPLKECHSR
jgi:glycosyltransferase involved in cell wall biosynthesis